MGSVSTELYQHEQDMFINRTLRAISVSLTSFASQIRTNHFDQFMIDIIEKSLIQFQLSLCGARFHLNYGILWTLPDSELFVIIEAFWVSQIHEYFTNMTTFQKSFNSYFQLEQFCKGDCFFLHHIIEFVASDFIKKAGKDIFKDYQLKKEKVEQCKQFEEMLGLFVQSPIKPIDVVTKALEASKKLKISKQVTEQILRHAAIYKKTLSTILYNSIPPVLSIIQINNLLFNCKTDAIKQLFGGQIRTEMSNPNEILYQILYNASINPKQMQQQILEKVYNGSEMINKQNTIVKQMEPQILSTISKTANASSYVIVHLVAKEAQRSCSNALKNMQQSAKLKVAKGMVSFSATILSQCYNDISEYNLHFSKQKISEKEVKQILLSASETESEDAFIFAEDKEPNIDDFIITGISKIIIIVINFAFLCYSETDIMVSQITGAVFPFGGFGCRIALQYLYQMQQYWQKYESIAYIFDYIKKLIICLIQAKDGKFLEQPVSQNIIAMRHYYDEYGRFFFASLFGICFYQRFNTVHDKFIMLYQSLRLQNEYVQQMVKKQIELLYSIPQYCTSVLAYTESIKFTQQKQSTINQNVLLSNEFKTFMQNKQFKDRKEFGIGVLSMPKSGATSLIFHLVNNPIFKFSNIIESLQGKDINFSPDSLISAPSIKNDSWKLLLQFEQTDTQRRVKEQQNLKNQNQDVSKCEGSMQCEASQKEQHASQKDTTETINIDQSISSFLRTMKSIDSLLKPSAEDKDEDEDSEKPKKIPINYDMTRQLNFAELLVNMPANIFRIESDNEEKGQLSTEERENQKQQMQMRHKKQIPPISFVRLEPLHTENISKYTIQLLQDPIVIFSDIPIFNIGVKVDQKQQEQMKQYKIDAQLNLNKLDMLKSQNNELQKQIVNLISQLFALFQKKLIAQQVMTTQQPIVGQLVNQKTRLLDGLQVEALIEHINKQLEQQIKNIETENNTYQNYQIQYNYLSGNEQITKEQLTKLLEQLDLQQKRIQTQQDIQQQLTSELVLVTSISDNNKKQVQCQIEIQQCSEKKQYLEQQLQVGSGINEASKMETIDLLQKQDIVLFVYDYSSEISNEILEILNKLQKVIVVCNKIDLLPAMNNNIAAIHQMLQFCQNKNILHLFISAKNGDFINDILKAAIIEQIDEIQAFKNFNGCVYKDQQ